MLTSESRAHAETCKLSIRISPELRQDLKAVTGLRGISVQSWIESLVRAELQRMEPALQALRSATNR
jgi:predicted HicB family RNase H-like nuclease